MTKIPVKSQTGVVLVTSLIMLVIMTLLVVSLVRTSVIELRIGGASQISAQNLANAEASIWAFMNAPAIRGRFFHAAVLDVDLTHHYTSMDTTFQHLKYVTLTAQEVACTEDAARGRGNMLGRAPDVVYFDVRAEARDPVFAGRTTVHQGIRAIAAADSCP